MVRTPCSDKSGLRKGTWTPEEDKKLSDYVTRYGCWNWRQLPKYAGLARCGKSCRLRWMNYLRPDLKHGKFTIEEDELIMQLHESLGNRWSAIAAQLPGRSDNEIKNHWHTSLKNASKKAPGESKRRSINRHRRSMESSYEIMNSTPVMKAQEILESSDFPQQPIQSSSLSLSSAASSSDLSSSFSPAVITTDELCTNNGLGEYDDFMSDLVSEYSGGSFWSTEPFLMDSDSTLISYPPSPFTTDVLLSSYDYYDHNSDINLVLW